MDAKVGGKGGWINELREKDLEEEDVWLDLKEDGFLGELVSTFKRKYLVSELEKF